MGVYLTILKLRDLSNEIQKSKGNFGHAGRPGQVGGSAPGGGRTTLPKNLDSMLIIDEINERSWDDANNVVNPVIEEINNSGIGGTVGNDLVYGGGYDELFESDTSEYIQEAFSEMITFNQTDIYHLSESEMYLKINSATEYLKKEVMNKINKTIDEIDKDIKNIDPDLSDENKIKYIEYLKQSKTNMEKKAKETSEKIIKINSDYRKIISDGFRSD